MALSIKDILNFDFDQRRMFRFDVSKMPRLHLEIEGKSYKINDMSLSGLSFSNEETEILLGDEFECYVNMHGDKVRIALKLIGKNNDRHGCEITQGLNAYEMFFSKHMSQLSPQQY